MVHLDLTLIIYSFSTQLKIVGINRLKDVSRIFHFLKHKYQNKHDFPNHTMNSSGPVAVLVSMLLIAAINSSLVNSISQSFSSIGDSEVQRRASAERLIY